MSIASRAQKNTHEDHRFFLGLANDAYQDSRRKRIEYAQLARERGLTHQQIADAYGITEAAVRQMLKRAAQ